MWVILELPSNQHDTKIPNKIALQTLGQLPNLSTTAQPSVQRVRPTLYILNSSSNSCVGKTICRLLYTLKNKKKYSKWSHGKHKWTLSLHKQGFF